MSSAPSAADLLELERVAYDLRVAPETEELDGWVLRHAHGVTSRANSVWPNAHGSAALAAKIDAAEEWYAARGLPPRFQLTDAAQPSALLTGSPGRTAFARSGDVAVGRGVAAGGWLGITSMVTVPAAWRRGHARAILATLIAWAFERGCSQAVLQVEAPNAPACGLYESFGFRPSHEYHCVVAP